MSNEINSAQCIKLEKIKNSYLFKESQDSLLSILTFFLLDDCGIEIESWKKWFLEEPYTSVGSNATYLIKDEKKNKVYISRIWDDDPDAEELELSGEQFLHILDRWEELLKERPKEIIITKEGEKITMEGIDDEQ